MGCTHRKKIFKCILQYMSTNWINDAAIFIRPTFVRQPDHDICRTHVGRTKLAAPNKLCTTVVTKTVWFQGSSCCAYGTTGKATKGYDCVIIPGAAKVTGALLKNQAICGKAGLVTKTTVMAGGTTICSKTIFTSLPFLPFYHFYHFYQFIIFITVLFFTTLLFLPFIEKQCLEIAQKELNMPFQNSGDKTDKWSDNFTSYWKI